MWTAKVDTPSTDDPVKVGDIGIVALVDKIELDGKLYPADA